MASPLFWKNKKVLVTGHTGFKGSWLLYLLNRLDAICFGLSLPAQQGSLFDQSSLLRTVMKEDCLCDIREYSSVKKFVKKVQPNVVFHLAAQPLVSKSYLSPVETWGINVMGTINLLESLKYIDNECDVVIITTDKVYRDMQDVYSYRENDFLGGFDPYSSSKAATELACQSWLSSYFYNQENPNVRLATARAGNVIGGGDFAEKRLIPDVIRASIAKKSVILRSVNSIRPWQHVLDALHGYLLLAENLIRCSQKFDPYNLNFNFGPSIDSFKTVQDVIDEIGKYLDVEVQLPGNIEFHETSRLFLNSDKSISCLGWNPIWDFTKTIELTTKWYVKHTVDSLQADALCLEDIDLFLNGLY